MSRLGMLLMWVADLLYGFRRYRTGDLFNALACEVLAA